MSTKNPQSLYWNHWNGVNQHDNYGDVNSGHSMLLDYKSISETNLVVYGAIGLGLLIIACCIFLCCVFLWGGCLYVFKTSYHNKKRSSPPSYNVISSDDHDEIDDI
eukprot:1095984_1